jgi:putative zinc finger protein
MSEPAHPRELLAAYLDDELTIEERSSVDRHLALCASCRKQLVSLAALARAVAEDPVPDVPADLAARIGRSIDEASVVPLRARRRYLVPASIAATIAAVGLLLVVQWRERAPAPEVPEFRRSRASESSPPPPPPPPPVERKQDLPVLDRLEQKGKEKAKERDQREEALRRPDAVEPSQDVGEREKLGSLGKVESATPAEAPPPPTPPFAPAPAPSSGAKNEQGVAGTVEGYVDDSRHRDARAQTDAELSRKSATAAEGRLYQNALSPDACGERWIDTSVLGVWFVEDRDRSLLDLTVLARRLAGRVEPVEPDPNQVALVVPRKRLPEMIGALRGHGVAGLEGPFTPEEGFDCVRQRIHIELRSRP